jgi:hypothetical protein
MNTIKVTKTTNSVQARLVTNIGFSYEAIFESELEPTEQLELSVNYPTLTFTEGEWDEDLNYFLPQEITVEGGYTDLVKWVLEVGEWTETGLVEQVQAIEVDWSSVRKMETGI